jgi:hypothetical protein
VAGSRIEFRILPLAGQLTSSEAMCAEMDYFTHSPATSALIEKPARTDPMTLAYMHGSAWRGDGGSLLRNLAGGLARA